MKKFIYISTLILALAGTSCNNEEDDIFDKSAALRTQEAADNYTSLLTSNGGLWSMEYFTNSDEPGYIYVMKFNSNGSVDISGKNEWIGTTAVQTETSLWEVISDYGPVLTFNSYNSLFHILSTPEDISSTSDIDEQGYGHEGDYEFILIEGNDSTLRTTGKKHNYTIMLRHLAENTNVETYYNSIDEMSANLFSTKFTTNIITDNNTGERFVVTGGASGVISVYPEAGDAVTQTETQSAVVNATGLRFASTVTVERATGTDSLAFQTFKYNATNGTLVCEEDENIVMTNMYLADLFIDMSYVWMIDSENIGGQFATAYAAAEEAMQTAYSGRRNLRSISFMGTTVNSVLTPCVRFMGGTAAGYMYTTVTRDGNEAVSVVATGSGNNNALRFIADAPALQTFLDLLGSTKFNITTESLLLPNTMKLTSTTNENDYIYVTVQ